MRISYRHTLYASYIGYITQAIVNNLPPLLFISFIRDFSISVDHIGLLIAVNFCTQIAVDILSARYADRIGYRKVIVFGHICSVLGLCCFAVLPFMMPPFIGLVIAIMLNAIGGGIIEVLISPIVEALPGDEKAAAMSLLHSFYCWGHVGVVLLSTLFFSIAGIASWRFLPLLWAVVPMLNSLLFAKVPLRTLSEQSGKNTDKTMFRSSAFWLLILLMICSAASEQSMSQWSSLFAETGLQVSKTLGDLFGPCLFAFLMGLSRLLYSRYTDKISIERALFASGILCILSYLLAVFAPHPLLSLCGCGLCGFSVGIMWPGTFSLGARIFPAGGTVMFALFAFAGDFGCGGGPAFVGWLSSLSGDGLSFGLLIASVFPFLLVAGVSALVWQRKQRMR